MAKNKKPSIYSDRGSIGSAKDLDEYGVWIKSEPQVLSTNNSSLDISADSPQFDIETDNIESQDDSFSFDDFTVNENDLESVSSIAEQASEPDNIDFPDSDEEIVFDDLNVGDINSSLEESDGLDMDLGDIDLGDTNLEDFSNEDFGIPTVKSIENNVSNIQKDFDTAVNNKEGDLSTQLLLKIASELSSLRVELQDLKKEFSTARSPSREEDDETIALTGDELDNIISSSEDVSQETAGEEDDETIALTGDEMDNILNSADFTEEAGTNETPENDFSFDEETASLSFDEPVDEHAEQNDILDDLGV
ncbi:MAG: hypothetical protein LBI12_03890, partial [Treponema sp.]|nr:hypothetical protein [Treponema sp.]